MYFKYGCYEFYKKLNEKKKLKTKMTSLYRPTQACETQYLTESYYLTKINPRLSTAGSLCLSGFTKLQTGEDIHRNVDKSTLEKFCFY